MASLAAIDDWTDGEIRTKLAELGTPVGPVTETTRKVLLKKLKRLLQLQNTNASTPTKRGSLARYSSGDEAQEETKMPPPSSKMRNRRKTTGAAELKTAIADSSIYSSISGRSDTNRNIRERRSLATSSSMVHSKSMDTDSDSDIADSSKLRKSRRYTSIVPDRLPQLNSSRQSPKKEPAKPWRERTPDSVLPSANSKLTPNLTKRSPEVFEYVEDEEDEVEEEEEEEEETEDEVSRPAYQSDLLKRLTTGGKFTSTYGSSDSPNREPYRSSIYSSLYSSTRTSDDYKTYLSKPNTLNSYSSGDKDRYSYLSARSPSVASSNVYKTKSMKSVLNQFFYKNLKLIAGGTAILIFLLVIYLFSNLDTRLHLDVIDSDDNKYPICGEVGVDPSICVENKNLKPTLEVSKVLVPWILGLTSKVYCDSSPGEYVEKPVISEAQAIKYLSSKMPNRPANLEKVLRNLKILIWSNPHWDIEVVSNETDNTEAILFNGGFAARSVDLPIGCYLKLTAYNTFKFLLMAALVCATIVAVIFGYRFYKFRQAHHKQEVYNMVNKVLNLLSSRHDQNVVPGYMAINNCRDELIQPIERDAKRKVWQDAVDFIEKYESRVRVEMHSVRGESVKVWRWLPAGSPPVSPSSSGGAPSPVLGRLL